MHRSATYEAPRAAELDVQFGPVETVSGFWCW